MSPVSLCAEKHYKELRKGIARTFRDGMGEKRLRMGEKRLRMGEKRLRMVRIVEKESF